MQSKKDQLELLQNEFRFYWNCLKKDNFSKDSLMQKCAEIAKEIRKLDGVVPE